MKFTKNNSFSVIAVMMGVAWFYPTTSVSADCSSFLLNNDQTGFASCRAASGNSPSREKTKTVPSAEVAKDAQDLQQELIVLRNQGVPKSKLRARACEYVKSRQQQAQSLSSYCHKIRTTIKNECMRNEPNSPHTCGHIGQKEADSCMTLSDYCKRGGKLEK